MKIIITTLLLVALVFQVSKAYPSLEGTGRQKMVLRITHDQYSCIPLLLHVAFTSQNYGDQSAIMLFILSAVIILLY